MGSPLGAANYISFLQGAANLKRLGNIRLLSMLAVLVVFSSPLTISLGFASRNDTFTFNGNAF